MKDNTIIKLTNLDTLEFRYFMSMNSCGMYFGDQANTIKWFIIKQKEFERNGHRYLAEKVDGSEIKLKDID